MNGQKVAEAKAVESIRDALVKAYSHKRVGEDVKAMNDSVKKSVDAMPKSRLRLNAENTIMQKLPEINIMRLAKIFNIVNGVDEEPIELLSNNSRK